MFTNITQKFDLLKTVLGGSHPQVPLLVILFIMLWYLVHSNVPDTTNRIDGAVIYSNISTLYTKAILG